MQNKKSLQLWVDPELHENLRKAALRRRPRVSMAELCRYYLQLGLERDQAEVSTDIPLLPP